MIVTGVVCINRLGCLHLHNSTPKSVICLEEFIGLKGEHPVRVNIDNYFGGFSL